MDLKESFFQAQLKCLEECDEKCFTVNVVADDYEDAIGVVIYTRDKLREKGYKAEFAARNIVGKIIYKLYIMK